MLYPNYLIEEIRSRADLVNIISRYVSLKRRGSNWVGLCPFHNEKTPSFCVNPQKGIYKCFGCGKGGNVFTFLMEMENLNFVDALREIARIEGIELPTQTFEKNEEASKKHETHKKLKEEIIRMNQLAMEFWEDQLSKNEGRKAREYLASRGISSSTVKLFRIGYALDSRAALLSFLKSQGFDEEIMRESGLFVVSERGLLDRFHHRIMFPIFDKNGNVVAFGGRVIDRNEPKYLNSPETPAYIKGHHLYGLFHSKDEIRRKKIAILVEGYLDLISLHQSGIKPVVASLGTALSDEQARLLAGFTRRVIVSYDGDNAGIKAAKRAIQMLLSKNIEAKVIVLPEGADPDTFIHQHGVKRYRESLKQAYSCQEFLLNVVIKNKGLAEALEESLSIIKAYTDDLKKREVFDGVLLHLGIKDAQYQRELWNQVKKSKEEFKEFRNLPESDSLKETIQSYLKSRLTKAERRLLELLYHNEKVRHFILPQIEKEDYNKLVTASIFEALLKLYEEEKEISLENLLEFIPEDDWHTDILAMIHLSELDPEKSEDEMLDEARRCLFRLRSMVIENKIQENDQLLRLAEQSGDTNRLQALVQEQIKLNRLRADIEKFLQS